MSHGFIGEQVRLFSSNTGTQVTTMSIFDINGVARTLDSTERLIITVLVATKGAIDCIVFDDADGDNTVDAGENLMQLGGTGVLTGFLADYRGEGLPCGRGRAPKVSSAGSGSFLILTGVGVIVKG